MGDTDARGEHADLEALIEQALVRVGREVRRVWCRESHDFDSRIASSRVELLGGVWTPQYLGNPTTPAWSLRLEGPTAICRAQDVREPLGDWIPLLESLAQAKEQLLLVASSIDPLVLTTLLVNQHRDGLHNVVVRPAPGRRGTSAPPRDAEGLVRTSRVWSRRDATAVFPKDATRWPEPLSEITVIEVGGENLAALSARVAFVERRLAELARG